MRSARALIASLLVVTAAARASAQDTGDAADKAMADMEKLRARQQLQLDRAKARAVSPIYGSASEIAPAPKDGRVDAVRMDAPPPERNAGEGAAPWLLPSIVVGALLVAWGVRRARLSYWSQLPGHTGLRRTSDETRARMRGRSGS